MKSLNSDKGKQPVRARSSRAEGLTTSDHPHNGSGNQYGDVRQPTTSDGLATATPPPNARSKFRGSLLVAASNALGFSFGRRRPPVRQVPASVGLSDVIEIRSARPDAEDEERDRLRKLAADAIGLDPNMPFSDSHSQSRASASATDTEEEEEDDAGLRQRYAQFAPGGGCGPPPLSPSYFGSAPPHIAAQSKSPARGRFRAGSLATRHSPSNSMTIATIPAFPTTVAALAPFREAAGVHPKYYPPSSESLRTFALSRNWKSRFLLLSSTAKLVTRGRTPTVSYLHVFKSAGADEKELERLEISEDSVVFVSEEKVGGLRHVIKVGGADIGAMHKEYTHEEGGHIMWALQIADPAEAQRWISNIQHTTLVQRTIPLLSLGNSEPRALASAISTPTSTTFKESASPLPDAYASSVSSHSVRSQDVPASPTSAVSAFNGLFSGARPRAASRPTSISSDRTLDRDDESFAKRGSNRLSMLRAGTPDTQSVHTVQSARTLPAPTALLPFAGPIALERRIKHRTIQDPARPLGAWVSAAAEQSSSTAGKERDRSSKGLSLSAMSLQLPTRNRWAASGASDAGATTPTGCPESARRVSFSAPREHSGGGGEAGLEGTTYWIAAEQALKHARTQALMISTIFGRYNIGESEYLVQAGFDESLIISNIGYLEQIHVFVSADLVDEVVTNLAPELGKIFSPFSSVLFTENFLYRLPVFLDTGMRREFDELVLSTASNIYHTAISSAANSPLTVIGLSQASGSGAHSMPQGGLNDDGGEESNKDSEGTKKQDKGKKRDDDSEEKKQQDSRNPDNGSHPPEGPEPVARSGQREIWFKVTSNLVAADNIKPFQKLVMDGTLIIEDPETQPHSSLPRRHAHFKALSFGSRANISGNIFEQMHVRIVIDSHSNIARVPHFGPKKTPATDGKEIQTIGSKESQNEAYTATLAASALPSGSVTVSRGKNNEKSTGSQITRNTSPITEFHDDGIIDWGFNINDPNSRGTGFDLDGALLPTVDFDFFGVPQLPEYMDFAIVSHWSMILPEKQSDLPWIRTAINNVRRIFARNEQGQAVFYSNLLQIVGMRTNPSKLPVTPHGYSATLDVKPGLNSQALEPQVNPDLPTLDSATFDTRSATIKVTPSDSVPPSRPAIKMFDEILQFSPDCIERLDGLCTIR